MASARAHLVVNSVEMHINYCFIRSSTCMTYPLFGKFSRLWLNQYSKPPCIPLQPHDKKTTWGGRNKVSDDQDLGGLALPPGDSSLAATSASATGASVFASVEGKEQSLYCL